MEIERKFLINPDNLTFDYKAYPCRKIVQAYLNINPVVRVRCDNDDYYLTYKGSGLLAREEANLPLNAEAFAHLLEKKDGLAIHKLRYVIPLKDIGYESPYDTCNIELDFFQEAHAPLVMAEVEFLSVEEANAFVPPTWFGDDVTDDRRYHNSNMI